MSIFDAIWRRRGRPSQYTQTNDVEPTYIVTQTDRDYSDLLKQGDVAIKFWLPELMDTVLHELSEYIHTTRSDLMRQTLFTYLYGRYDLFGFVERNDRHYQLNRPVLFQKARQSLDDVSEPEPDIMQDLGKNTEDLKVWIPVRMKDDIQKLADKASISLSEMIREIIISALFGHTYLSARKELMQMEIEVEDETEN